MNWKTAFLFLSSQRGSAVWTSARNARNWDSKWPDSAQRRMQQHPTRLMEALSSAWGVAEIGSARFEPRQETILGSLLG